jgi:hypothetical protein
MDDDAKCDDRSYNRIISTWIAHACGPPAAWLFSVVRSLARMLSLQSDPIEELCASIHSNSSDATKFFVAHGGNVGER